MRRKKKLKSFKEKVILITGGAGGLGNCLAREFLKEGSKIVICDIREEDLKKTVEKLQSEFKNGVIKGYVCDLTKFKKIEEY